MVTEHLVMGNMKDGACKIIRNYKRG